MEGIAEGIAAATKLGSGHLADRRTRRPLVALGYGLAAIGKVIIALAGSWPLVLIGRGVDRVGKGIRGAPRDALLMTGADPAARGRIFGVHRAADTVGAIVGPLIGLALYELLGHQIRPLLVIAVIPAVLSVALVRLVREPRTPAAAPASAVRAPRAAGQRLPAQLRGLIAALALFSLVNFPDALLLLRASDLGLPLPGVIAAYALYNTVYAALAYPASALTDRVPHHFVFATGLACFAAGYIGLGLIHQPAWVFLLLPIYGGFAACTDGVGKAWIATLAPPTMQGRAQGLYQASTGAGVLIAGTWAGLAWGHAGQLPLLIAGIAALPAALALLLLGTRHRLADPKH